MADAKIEWTDKTWNPITGCTKISEGCRNCYAERMSKRMAGRFGYPLDDPFQVVFHPDKLEEPLKWRKPSRIFVCSMGDLFHGDVQDGVLDEIFGVILGCKIFKNTPDHIFQILTKRPECMKDYLTSRTPVELLKAWANACPWHTDNPDATVEDIVYSATCRDWDETGRNSSGSEYKPWGYINKIWPLPNVWLGVTAENQARADERIPTLLQTPAAKRFVSVEPMLEPVDLQSDILGDTLCRCNGCMDLAKSAPEMWQSQRIDWVICGGETGPGARPLHPNWVRSLRDQCLAAGTPFFFKSWGGWFPRDQWEYNPDLILPDDDEAYINSANTHVFNCTTGVYPVHRVGNKAAGRLLDGREWNEWPGVRA